MKKFKFSFKCLFEVWNDDLAKNAEFHVRRCIFAHDECRTTGDCDSDTETFVCEMKVFEIWIFLGVFRSPGQNVAIDLYELPWVSYDKSDAEHVEHLMSGWWDHEYMNADMSIIKDFILPDDKFE